MTVLLNFIPSVLGLIVIPEINVHRILHVFENAEILFESFDIKCLISDPRFWKKRGGIGILASIWLYFCKKISKTQKHELKSADKYQRAFKEKKVT